MTVSANGADFRYALDLAAEGPLVLHGENGFSRKSDDGRASYYFSQPFFKIDGVLVIRGREVKVSGLAWMDREWSSQPLTATQKGWDWFSLHFSNGEKLMVFRLRDETDRGFSAGTWIGADGTSQALDPNDIVLMPLLQINLAGRTLPSRWRLQVPSHGLDIETAPVNRRQLDGYALFILGRPDQLPRISPGQRLFGDDRLLSARGRTRAACEKVDAGFSQMAASFGPAHSHARDRATSLGSSPCSTGSMIGCSRRKATKKSIRVGNIRATPSPGTALSE